MNKPRYKWQPMKLATYLKPPSEELIKLTAESYGVDDDKAVDIINEYEMTVKIYINDIYQVQVRDIQGKLVHLNIRRRDGGPIMRDWRHFQQIKNELVGPECEAIELYPAESRKVDASNKFHLWAVKDPEYRFPIGFDERDVQYGTSKDPGLKQRPK
jgi:hypothetical protein